MRHDECIFAAEEDCPKEHIKLSCEDCGKFKYYESIKKAVDDFTAMGDAFTDMFVLCNNLIKGNGKTVEIDMPLESIHKINRVMTTFLSKNGAETSEDVVYKRLIFYFFGIVVDEFETEEYEYKPIH